MSGMSQASVPWCAREHVVTRVGASTAIRYPGGVLRVSLTGSIFCSNASSLRKTHNRATTHIYRTRGIGNRRPIGMVWCMK